MSSSQVLLILEVDDDGASYAIPGKLFDYLNSNRPIVSIGPDKSDVKDILSKTSSGKFFNYKDYNSLKFHLEKLYKNYKHNLSDKNNRKNIEIYHRKNLTSKLVGVISKVAKMKY